MLTAAVVCSWLGLLVWGVASSRRGRVWWAVLGFVLSQTVYVPTIAAAIAAAVGSAHSCNQFMNVWGLVSAFAVIGCLVVRHRATMTVTVALGVAAVAAVAVLAVVERPSPVGCVTSIDVPPTSPYWWILVVAHVVSSLLAVLVCATDSYRSGSRDPALTFGTSALAVAFGASVAFWLAMGATLVTGDRTVGAAASAYVFPITVVATAVAVWIPSLDRIVRLVRYRRRLASTWERWTRAQRAAHPGREMPRRWDVLGAWWADPDLAVHQLEIQIADAELTAAQQAPTRTPTELR